MFMLNRILQFLKIQIIQLIIIKNYLKKIFQIKWMTLSGSTEPKENDQLGLANVKILKDGSVVNEKVISFVSKGVKTITDVIG